MVPLRGVKPPSTASLRWVESQGGVDLNFFLFFFSSVTVYIVGCHVFGYTYHVFINLT